jgi:hypothetical protein
MLASPRRSLHTGDTVEVEIKLSQSEEVSVRARVVWTGKDGAGLAFLERNPDLVATVTAIVSARKMRYYPVQ